MGLVVGLEYSPRAVKSSVFKHLANWVSVTFFMSIHFLLISLCRNPIPTDRCTASSSSWICKITCLVEITLIYTRQDI